MASPETFSSEHREIQQPSIVRILQWNIWHHAPVDAVINHLKEIDADVLCLQEVSTDSSYNPGINVADRIANAMGMDSHYAKTVYVRSDERFVDDGTGIFSRFPMDDKTTVVLSHGGWDLKYKERDMRRSYVGAEITIPGKNKKLTVGTTHLTTPAPLLSQMRLRRSEGDALALIVQNRDDFILTGDFNAGKRAYSVKEVSRRLQRQPLSEPTFKGKVMGIPMKTAIDHVFASQNVNVRDVQILAQGPSDHRPILLEVAI